MQTKNDQTEVLIIGGGIAGITTALELLDNNQKVMLIDRDSEENFGGLAKDSFGGMFFVDSPQQRKSGIKDSPAQALKDWYSTAEYDAVDYWPKAWAKQYVYNCTTYVQKWLSNKKIKFFPVVHWVERGLKKQGNSVPRFHMVWGTGFELIRVLVKNLKSHPKAALNLTLKFGYKAEDLIYDGTKVQGVSGVIEATDQPFEIKADSTVVAAGGMGGSIQKVKQHWYKPWGEPPKRLLNGLKPTIDGSMIDAVEKVNGNTTHLDLMWHYAAGIHHPRPKFEGQGLSMVPPKSALWLNYKGERIGPEPLVTGYDTRFLVSQVAKQKKKYSWQVLNMKIAMKEFAISGAEFNPAIRDKKFLKFLLTILFGNKALVNDMIDNCIDFVTADSIEELAKKMNTLEGTDDVDVEVLKAEINNYDTEIDKGKNNFTDGQLLRIAKAREYKGDKARTCKFQKINDPKAMPLIAIREFIITRKTLGGVQTDLQCRVLQTDQKSTISGLYAVGESAGFGGGGMHGKGALEGTFLGGCVLTGRIAAATISGINLITD
jgi:predicted oxidoreductase